MLSLKVKLKLNDNQKMIINTLSNEHRLLYNHLLNKVHTEGTNFKMIRQWYKDYRKSNNLTINSKSSQITTDSLINNIKSYYVLRKYDKTSKFPYKFLSYKIFKTFSYDWNSGNGGFKIKDNNLIINLLSSSIKSKKLVIKLPDICLIITENNIKFLSISKNDNDYFISFVYKENKKYNDLNKNNFVSLDLGVSNLYTLVSNIIDPYSLSNKKFNRIEYRIKHIHSKMDNKINGSRRYIKLKNKFTKLKRKQSNKNRDYQHKSSKYLINECLKNNIGTIICGDLKTKSIIKHNNKKIESTSKSLGLSRFKNYINYKSKIANIDFVLVNESFTSQINCLTNELDFVDLKLSDRILKLKQNIFIDRDLNSAINISQKIKGKWLTQIENTIRSFHKIYLDDNSSMIKT